ncbi:MAG: sensor histidine kinase [Flavobacteriales bacterium]|jgi:signal transduction histidine kinase|nr:sensor histidine kinase [Flavobacteriales bacterium]
MRKLLAFAALLSSPALPGQTPVLDSLLRVLPAQRGAQRCRTLSEVQWELGFRDAQRALAFGAEELRLAESLKDSALIAQALNDMAITEYRLGRHRHAIDLNMRALRIRAALHDSVGMAASHSKVGVAYTDLMEFDSALAHNYSAARIYAGLGDVLRSAQVRGNIGHLYQQMSDLPAAERITRETVAILRGQQNDYALAAAIGQLCQVLQHMNRPDEALAAGQEAMELYEKVGSKMDVANLNNELGQVSRHRGDDDAGLAYYKRALELGEESGDLNGVATYALNVAKALVDLGRPKEALPLFERSVALCRAEGYDDQRMSALAGWVAALERTGDLGGALALQKELTGLRDSVYSTQRLSALTDMQVRYETERTEKELAEERQRGLEQENRIVRQRLLIAISAGSALLVLLGAWFVVSRQRARLKAERDAAIIAERDQGLKALVESTDAERKRIASELHDGVGQLLTGLRMRMEAGASGAPDWDELKTLAVDASNEVRGIAHRMMPRALGELGLAPAIGDMLEKTLKLPGMRHAYEHFGLEGRLPPELETGVYRIAQELVTNAAKHAKAQLVNVQLMRNKGWLILIVEDDGVGFDAQGRSAGIGLQGLRDRARVLRGTLAIASTPGAGTVVTLRIPLTNGHPE